MEFALQGLQMLTPTVLGWMLAGVVVCQIVVIIPGLSGHLLLALILPFLYTMDPMAGIGLMVGAAVTAGTGNTITSVLFGVPGNAAGVATLFDGYPMAQKGLASKAIVAGLLASAVGGVIGAISLAVVLPLARPLALALGPPEYFMLVLLALVFMAFAGEDDLLKGLLAGAVGLLLAFVGQERSAGELRYTFGQLTLWDGISLPAFAIGIYGVAELLDLIRRGGSIALGGRAAYTKTGVREGIRDLTGSWRIVLQSSLVGTVVGMLPGIGGSASQFMAYSLAKRTSPEGEDFGTGRVEGVIAADASVNATDAAALAPTLGLGIPGSPVAALLLAGFVIMGVRPGPELLTDGLGTIWLVIWVLVLANVLAVAMCVWAAQPLSRLTLLPSVYLVPVILALALFGVVEADNTVASIPIVLGLGVMGYLMKRHGWSRATMIIAFVLGDILERNYLLSMNIHGPTFFWQPLPMGIVLVPGGLLVLAAVVKRRVERKERNGVRL
jgi:putative tricarboxylic transport membrane protein